MTKKEKFRWIYWSAALAPFLRTKMLFYPDSSDNKELSYNTFLDSLKSVGVERIILFQDRIIGQFRTKNNPISQKLGVCDNYALEIAHAQH